MNKQYHENKIVLSLEGRRWFIEHYRSAADAVNRLNPISRTDCTACYLFLKEATNGFQQPIRG